MKNIFLLLAVATMAIAGTTGKLSGTITDAATKEPVTGAIIQVIGTPLGAVSDVDGRFIILNLQPGTYAVKVSMLGYDPVTVENIKIFVDQTTPLTVTLLQSSVQMKEVVVSAEAPAIQKDVTSSISVISPGDIDALPVATFTELIGLQAGVVGSGNNFHVRGGRANEVAYLIDGAYVQDPLLGGLATQINNDAIQEMSLLSGTFNAEYGNAMSGIVNIVTKEGQENFSGKAEMRTTEFGIQEYERLHEMRYSATISGPLYFQKLKFFASGENDRRGSYLPFGYHNSKTFFTKLTYSGISSVKLSLSNRGSSGEYKNYSHAFKYIPEMYEKTYTDSYQSSVNITHTLGETFFYDVNVSYFNQGINSGMDKDTSQYIGINDEIYIDTEENGTTYRDFYA
ncbi:MAG: carboxypeptidase-like regulatory domain-containing protein, partial [Bacteroidetes bacterium]|nr:carboxypeptidase-like regulatory domain-containing protein [Bacteroidota bacterium]